MAFLDNIGIDKKLIGGFMKAELKSCC